MIALGLWRYAIYAAAIVAFIAFIGYQKGEYDRKQQAIGAAPYIAAIENQKREAAALLASEIAKNEAFAKGLNDDYAKQIAVLRARKPSGVRLVDPGRRESGTCPPNNSPIPENPAPSSGLSGEATAFLLSEAQRADEAATYAAKCQEYVIKPTVKQQVNKLRGVSQ